MAKILDHGVRYVKCNVAYKTYWRDLARAALAALSQAEQPRGATEPSASGQAAQDRPNGREAPSNTAAGASPEQIAALVKAAQMWHSRRARFAKLVTMSPPPAILEKEKKLISQAEEWIIRALASFTHQSEEKP